MIFCLTVRVISMNSLNFVNDSNVVGGLAQRSYAYNFSHLPTEKVCLSGMNIDQAASVSSKRTTAANEMDNLLLAVGKRKGPLVTVQPLLRGPT